jgi:glycosyltransferase involved in cell wall biosynthesis
MATYNGQNFLKEQIESILAQMKVVDELIIVDDASKDKTVDIIKSFEDTRIKLYINEYNKGVNNSFERAISLSQKEYIFLSDQDDIWVENRVSKMLNHLLINDTAYLVTSNSMFIDENDQEIVFIQDKAEERLSNRNFKNIINIFIGKEYYFGCTMLLHKKMKPLILPFPNYIESHDLWIAKVANIIGRNLHLNDITLKRRIHGNNASVISRRLIPKLWSRIIFLWSIIEATKRIIKS